MSKANLRGVNLRGFDLNGANLSQAYLRKVNLRGANLSKANLRGTNLNGANLRKVNLSQTDLNGANLNGVNLSGFDLSQTDLNGANLNGTNLSRTNLNGANLSQTDLRGANLSQADLRGANLSDTNLNGFNLSSFDLKGSNLSRVQILGTNFEKSVLTGACLEDWNINSTTNFDGVVCEYVYLKVNQQERRPSEGTFKPGEFTALFQQAVDTIDLIFKDGIDWQAFFQSFQDLRSQYADQDLSIQAIERKQGGAFVVRLEVAEGADKKAIEGSAKALYETKLTLLEQRYRAELQAKDGEIVAYREQSANLMKITEMLATRPPMSEGNKYDLRGAQFGGGYVAGNVEGNQYGGIINNYGPNTEDITRLLTALRDQAQTFSTEQKDEANDTLDLLERDLADEQPDPGRIGRRLKRLVAIATTLTIGATAFTADLAQLADVLNVPLPQIEQVQPEQLPPSGTP